MTIENTALWRILEDHSDPRLIGKAADVQTATTDWLAYIPQTFPHYTRHTAGHSAEIIRQLSRLLFHDPTDPGSASIPLNAASAYLLVLAAFLHDAGMVVSDAEKAE